MCVCVCVQEEFLLGGKIGSRADLEGIVYDFFVTRYGSRASSELHLSAFLYAVQKHRWVTGGPWHYMNHT